jgi:hypothetical protein
MNARPQKSTDKREIGLVMIVKHAVKNLSLFRSTYAGLLDKILGKFIRAHTSPPARDCGAESCVGARREGRVMDLEKCTAPAHGCGAGEVLDKKS